MRRRYERMAPWAWIISCLYLIAVGVYDIATYVSPGMRSWLYLGGIAAMTVTAHIERMARLR